MPSTGSAPNLRGGEPFPDFAERANPVLSRRSFVNVLRRKSKTLRVTSDNSRDDSSISRFKSLFSLKVNHSKTRPMNNISTFDDSDCTKTRPPLPTSPSFLVDLDSTPNAVPPPLFIESPRSPRVRQHSDPLLYRSYSGQSPVEKGSLSPTSSPRPSMTRSPSFISRTSSRRSQQSDEAIEGIVRGQRVQEGSESDLREATAQGNVVLCDKEIMKLSGVEVKRPRKTSKNTVPHDSASVEEKTVVLASRFTIGADGQWVSQADCVVASL
eukprot:Rmarinus@m.12210